MAEDVLQRPVPDERLVDAALDGGTVQPQAAGGVGLRIEVDE